ncbi:MAG: MazG nucleotide pyrophosphohydrolase domain-containing protein [Caldilineaceae bacterium]
MLELLQKEELSLRDMQAFHTKLDAAKGFDTDFIKNVAYFTAEVGEMINAYRHYNKTVHRVHANGDAEHAHDHLAEELADCLAYVVKLANYAEVDLEAAYVRKMTRNVGREWSGIDLGEA